MEADGGAFIVVWMDRYGAFLTGFLGMQGFDTFFKRHLYAESQIFASSHAIGMYQTLARYLAAHCSGFLFWPLWEELGGRG